MGIVVGYLATPEGHAALDAAVEEARRRSVPVVVVLSTRPDEPQERREQTRQDLEGVREELDSLGVAHDIRLLEGGDVADDLISTAEAVGAERIVLGLRRRSPVGKLILGSNAQRVLFDAPCPVLTVKPAG
ncbi:universal stress protein [Cellulomonas wangsupingiae]|uniref:Universal stress protein n=1 Tax=Cellulomonas wangsupingiae TaxID=2968085 RepID=A0ABY5JZN5_9CELL|nr:universal stress protein [Cellulomonas wangsupingiae]MCC2333462.1 universal stress protein [Cellulomonas wangsupingiae]MCM0638312.1 universal stress protein [Cellulomonas wangsupingiae]UUI63647.1 universal stress protein [Cellulomonas wangsupingiae]